jgi:hypothetical protein
MGKGFPDKVSPGDPSGLIERGESILSNILFILVFYPEIFRAYPVVSRDDSGPANAID